MIQIISLYLPKSMSKIVDVGIKNYGVTAELPTIIPKNIFEFIIKFMHQKQAQLFSQNYQMVSPYSLLDAEQQKLLQKFPLQLEQNAYIIDTHSQNIDEIYDIYIQAIARLEAYLNKQNISLLNFDLQNHKFGDLLTNINDVNIALDHPEQNYDNNKDLISKFNLIINCYLKLDVYSNQISYIINNGAIMIFITLLSVALMIFQNYWTSKMSSAVCRDLRNDLFAQILRFSKQEFNKISVSSLITRTTIDVHQVNEFLLLGIKMIVPPVTLISGIILIINKNLYINLAILLGGLLVGIMVSLFFYAIFPKISVMQTLLDEFNLILIERLSGAAVIKSFCREKFEECRFNQNNIRLTNIQAFVNKLTLFITPILTIFMNLLTAVIIWIGAKEIQNFRMSIGELMAYMQYCYVIIASFLILVLLLSSIPKMMISVNRVCEILNISPVIFETKLPKIINHNVQGILKLDSVSFKYGSANNKSVNFALKNITFVAHPRTITTILGTTGSGKTTLADIILRFYDTEFGHVFIDNIDTKSILLSDLYNIISYIPQNSMLFSGDVRSNLKYGNPEIDDAEIIKCLKAVQLPEFATAQGLNHKIVQGGNNLSGGQKQRLTIARGLLKKAKIYIFDDCFSALDFKTAHNLRNSVIKTIKKSTIIVITHRTAIAMQSDQIIFLDNGTISCQGNPNHVLKHCSKFSKLCALQSYQEKILYDL